MENVKHEIPPIFDKNSKILVLGSFPSVKSRESQFFYHHPQNRFWKILAHIYNEDIPISLNDKKSFLTKHKIALWDVINSCTIIGSSDSSIKNVIVNDIKPLIDKTEIKYIYTLGYKAYSWYNKYLLNDMKINAVYLPSSSPANASIKYKNIINEYKKIVSN